MVQKIKSIWRIWIRPLIFRIIESVHRTKYTLIDPAFISTFVLKIVFNYLNITSLLRQLKLYQSTSTWRHYCDRSSCIKVPRHDVTTATAQTVSKYLDMTSLLRPLKLYQSTSTWCYVLVTAAVEASCDKVQCAQFNIPRNGDITTTAEVSSNKLYI